MTPKGTGKGMGQMSCGHTRTLLRIGLCSALCGAALLAAGVAQASSDDPVSAGGASEPTTYQRDGLDRVNLYNGALNVSIPLGLTYRLDGGFSYGFGLYFSSDLWVEETIQCNGNPPFETEYAEPRYDGGGLPVAFGWRLLLGPTLWQTSSLSPEFIGSDGARHRFTFEDSNDTVAVAQDGSFLRLRKLGTAGQFEVDFPDGSVARFTNSRLGSVRDAFGQTVLTYEYLAGEVKITDGAGRSHVVVTDGLARELKLAAFGNATATYTFNAERTTIDRLDGGLFCEGATVEESLLRGVTLPDGSRYAFEYYTAKKTLLATPGDPFDQEFGRSGHLKTMDLPTGGRYEWRYSGSSDAGGTAPARVLSKRIFENPGAAPTAIWRYRREDLTDGSGSPGHRVIVRGPDDPLDPNDGNEVVHYFRPRAIATTEGMVGFWFRGLPFDGTQANSRLSTDSTLRAAGHRLYLSTEIYDGYETGGSKLRSHYLRYTVDDPFLPRHDEEPFEQPTRLLGTMTVYHDDGDLIVETFNTDYDGFGNHRVEQRWASTDPDAKLTQVTGYNRHLTGLDPESITDWLLTTYDFVETRFGGQISRSEFCFDTSNGFLERSRRLQSFGRQRGATDLIVTHEMEIDGDGDPTGNVAKVALFGADRTPLTGALVSGELCTTDAESALDGATPSHLQAFTYTAGTVATSAVLDPSNDEVFLPGVNQTLDGNTGLASTSTSPNGVVTTLAYDALGRPTSQSTSGLPTTTMTYCLATIEECDGNEVSSLVAAGEDTVSETTVYLDGLGRKRESATEASTGQGSVETLRTLYGYDNRDRLVVQTVCETAPDLLGERATRFEYDALGRQTSLEAPDGSVLTFAHQGIRSTVTGYHVHTSEGDLPFEREAILDPVRGLQVEAKEASGAEGGMTSTTYAYDVGGRLTQVSTEGQIRTFAYDNLGWLRQADHAELTVAVEYSGYDVLGNAHRVETDTRAVLSSFDAAGRLVSQAEELAGGAERPLVTLLYATSNRGPDKRATKLAWARRHNYPPVNPAEGASSPHHHFVASERYAYEHPAGLVSDLKTTLVSLDDDGSTRNRKDLLFEQGYEYDGAGLTSAIEYPSAGLVGGPQDVLTADFTHHHGALSELLTGGSALATLGYGRGALTSVGFRNGAVQNIELDPSGIQRTARIFVTFGGETIWDTEAYAYDGSGKITAIGSDTYVYDGISRLEQSTVASKQQTASYDIFGNLAGLTTNDRSAAVDVDPVTNRLRNVDGSTFSYDLFGNITRWNGRALAYDPYDMLSASDFGDRTRAFIYGPSQRRLATFESDTGDLRLTVRGPGGRVLSEFRATGETLDWQRDYVYRDRSLLAARHPDGAGGTGWRYFHLDHLGNTRVVTDGAGASVAEYDFFPFGELATKTGEEADLETLLFTGHERDANESDNATDDLDYMLARYYHPHLGRFLSVDPVLGNAGSPQSWNRYSYVDNRPLFYVDPDGRKEKASFNFGKLVDALDFNFEFNAGFNIKTGRTEIGAKIFDETFYTTYYFDGEPKVFKDTRGVSEISAVFFGLAGAQYVYTDGEGGKWEIVLPKKLKKWLQIEGSLDDEGEIGGRLEFGFTFLLGGELSIDLIGFVEETFKQLGIDGVEFNLEAARDLIGQVPAEVQELLEAYARMREAGILPGPPPQEEDVEQQVGSPSAGLS